VLDAESGRPADAVAHWKAAIALDPNELQKLFAFAMVVARSGGRAAQPYLQLFVDSAPPDRFDREIRRARELLK
jgi:hypothetical protein